MKTYIETSAILYLLADNETYKKDRTIEMFEQLAAIDAELQISSIVDSELAKAQPVMSKCISAIMEKKKINRIPLSKEQIELAKDMINTSIFPSERIIEALHISTSLLSSCDILISWDFEYLLKGTLLFELKKSLNKKNLTPLIIGTPEMFLREGFDNPKTLENLRGLRNQLPGINDISKMIS